MRSGCHTKATSNLQPPTSKMGASVGAFAYYLKTFQVEPPKDSSQLSTTIKFFGANAPVDASVAVQRVNENAAKMRAQQQDEIRGLVRGDVNVNVVEEVKRGTLVERPLKVNVAEEVKEVEFKA